MRTQRALGVGWTVVLTLLLLACCVSAAVAPDVNVTDTIALSSAARTYLHAGATYTVRVQNVRYARDGAPLGVSLLLSSNDATQGTGELHAGEEAQTVAGRLLLQSFVGRDPNASAGFTLMFGAPQALATPSTPVPSTNASAYEDVSARAATVTGCTQTRRVCSDGSYVTSMPPNCGLLPCPGESFATPGAPPRPDTTAITPLVRSPSASSRLLVVITVLIVLAIAYAVVRRT